MDRLWNPVEEAQVERMTRCSVVGSQATLRDQTQSLLKATQADEIIATAHIYDPSARLRSFEIASQVFQDLPKSPTT